MHKYILLCALPIVVLVALVKRPAAPLIEKNQQAASVKMQQDSGFALIELFTSQGCSSCPPADKLLGALAMANDVQVLPLAFHVDYWNRLGWKDPFSDARYSQRQREYAGVFNLDGVYTPQAVVNGKRQMVGSDAGLLAAAIAAAKATVPTVSIHMVALQQQAGKIDIQYTMDGDYSGAKLQAALVQKQVETHIKAGENNGLSLMNYHIVRDIHTVPATAKGKVQLQIPATNATGVFSVVLFVQQSDGRIIGVAQQQVS